MTLLWHFTCEHGARGIDALGAVLPWPQPALEGLAVSWWTDLETPDRRGLGLMCHALACDRTRHRFMAVNSDGLIVPWWRLRRELQLGILLDCATGAMPARWWCATEAIPAVRS